MSPDQATSDGSWAGEPEWDDEPSTDDAYTEYIGRELLSHMQSK